MSGADLAVNLRRMAAALRDAPREGGETDSPEGTQFIQISDTMVRQMTQTLDQAADELAGPEGLQARPGLVAVTVVCPDPRAASDLSQRLRMVMTDLGRAVHVPRAEALDASRSAQSRAAARQLWTHGEPAPGSVAHSLERARASTHPGAEAFPLIGALDRVVTGESVIVDAMAEEVEGYFDDLAAIPNEDREPWVEPIMAAWYDFDPDRRAALSGALRERMRAALEGVLKGLRP